MQDVRSRSRVLSDSYELQFKRQLRRLKASILVYEKETANLWLGTLVNSDYVSAEPVLAPYVSRCEITHAAFIITKIITRGIRGNQP